MPDFDPLRASHDALADIIESATPPDASGDNDSIQNLDGLLRHEEGSTPGARWIHPPAAPQTPAHELIVGGIHPLPDHETKTVAPNGRSPYWSQDPQPAPRPGDDR